jgi:hypothetical protein
MKMGASPHAGAALGQRASGAAPHLIGMEEETK